LTKAFAIGADVNEYAWMRISVLAWLISFTILWLLELIPAANQKQYGLARRLLCGASSMF